MNRRTFLRHAGAAGVAGAAAIVTPRAAFAADPSLAPFLHGVASGDPLADRVMLWTRVDPAGAAVGGLPVEWLVATDPALTQVVRQGTTTAEPSRDWCVKVDADGLDPGTTYYYGFRSGGVSSLTGRTKTAPAIGTEVDRLRFAVVSCSNYPSGYFNAYRRISERQDLDVVLHLGDYLYESGSQGSIGRGAQPPKEMVTIDEYRARYSQYRLDPDLRRLHQQYAFINVWDDHESTNNSWSTGASNHQPATEGDWFERKAVSARVYDEWLPIRLPDANDRERIYRSFQYGGLVDLLMLDTRLEGRDQQLGSAFVTNPETDDESRTILGFEQEDWLRDQLAASKQAGTTWRILGQQVMLAPFNAQGMPDTEQLTFLRRGGTALNPDQWDGYTANRRRLYDWLEGANPAQEKIDNVVVLTGDIHTSWAMDVPPDPYSPTRYNPVTGEGSLAVEFVTPSITSTNFDDSTGVPSDGLEVAVRSQNPHMKFVELDSNGYLLLDITPERVQSDWYFVDRVDAPSTSESFVESWKTDAGTNRLSPGTQAAPGPGAAAAPETPPNGPVPVLPEVSTVALLPVAAVAAVGGAIALRRRGERPASPA